MATMSEQIAEESDYPNLAATGYKKTSERSHRYNCVSWAAEDTEQWWEAQLKEPGVYWPKGVKEGIRVGNYVQLFQFLGYVPCGNENTRLESGFEKVAIYGDGGVFQHVARQLSDGEWTSKLGPDEDIKHKSLEAFNGAGWGKVVKVMKRKIKR